MASTSFKQVRLQSLSCCEHSFMLIIGNGYAANPAAGADDCAADAIELERCK